MKPWLWPSALLIFLFASCPTSFARQQYWMVKPDYLGAHTGKMIIYQKSSGQWVYDKSIKVVVGKNGIDSSLIPLLLPPFFGKTEGDKKTPQGLYQIKSLFTSEKTSSHRQWPLHVTSQKSYLIDTPWHPLYNQWSNQIQQGEAMLREDGLYRKGLELNFNPYPTRPYYGSAIFIHRWKAPKSPTAGCIAMRSDHLDELWQVLANLTPGAVQIRIQWLP